MTTNICDIEKLVKLFDTASKNSDQFDDEELGSSKTLSENQVQCSNSGVKKSNPYEKTEPLQRKNVSDTEGFFDDTCSEQPEQNCWKTTPKWEISYRQSVSSSDMYLSMGLKNPSTSSCEDMVITVDLPDENRQNIDLKIDIDKLTLTSAKFFLNLKLPHPVDPKKGGAQFDKDEEKLIITLIMRRELDLVNF